LDNVCLVIDYNENSQTYQYIGGCYKDNKLYEYKTAYPNKEYK